MINSLPSERDHPRIRGEHARVSAYNPVPRGIIPAYAGNTDGGVKRRRELQGSSPHTRGTPCRAATGRPSPRDHPRIRGEHETMHRAHVVDPGIIPAYAGNTMSALYESVFSQGSSPHTRGTHLFTCDPNSRRGSFVSLHPNRRALCLLPASLQPDFLAP